MKTISAHASAMNIHSMPRTAYKSEPNPETFNLSYLITPNCIYISKSNYSECKKDMFVPLSSKAGSKVVLHTSKADSTGVSHSVLVYAHLS